LRIPGGYKIMRIFVMGFISELIWDLSYKNMINNRVPPKTAELVSIIGKVVL
jgi:hypothetical protein